MTIDAPTPLSMSDCADRLGRPRLQLWFQHRRGRFAAPAGHADGAPYWYERELYQWAARAGRPLVRAVPVRYWPEAATPARYLGTREMPGTAVAQLWHTTTGRVCVVWPLPEVMDVSVDQVADCAPDADTLVRVQADFGLDGPGLATAEPATASDWTDGVRWADFGAMWADLVRVLGQPAPYWPYMLRVPHLITAWEPGVDTVVYPTVPEVDTTPLLRLAAALPEESPARETLLHLVRVAQHRSHVSALQDLDGVNEHVHRAGIGGAVVHAARPMSVPDPDENKPAEAIRRAGWREILGRSDRLAVECVRESIQWDGGADFAHPKVERFDPADTAHGTEWAQRLEPTARTAAIARLDPDGHGEALIDPAIDAPAVRLPGRKVAAAVPRRLTTISPLAELVLGSPLWVRTEDGTVYVAPEHHYFGLSWGYGGSGPHSLALLIHRLLDDITAPAADGATGVATDGLTALVQRDWPAGTVFTRAQLEAARDGRPYAVS